MGRVSTREQRVRLFQRGNDRCPICLTCFTEEGIEAGKEVTLEHVPPRSFALGGLAMCLTCAECNNRASRAEQVAAAVIKGREKVRVDVPGLPPLSAYVPQRDKNGVWQLITPQRTDIPRNFFEAGWREANRTGLTIHGWTTPHYKDVPWLKAAYLASEIPSFYHVNKRQKRGQSSRIHTWRVPKFGLESCRMHPHEIHSASSDQRLQRRDLLGFIDTLYDGDLHAKRVLSLANATLGVLVSASLAIHAVGRGLAQAMGTLTKHGVKQVDRLLSNRGVDVWTFFEYWTPYIVGARTEVVVVLDWTSFAADGQDTIVLSMVTGHGRATPLLWKTVASSTLKGNQRRIEYELLARLREVLPDGVKVTVLADRGFADCKLFYALATELGFEYVIRLRGDVYVTNARGERRLAAGWVGAGGRARRLVGARVTDVHEFEVGVVVCVHDRKMDEPWCLVASDATIPTRVLIRYYGKRWGIEAGFRDIKDMRFGMGLSSMHVARPERRDRLLLISALAIAVLSLLGAAGECIGYDRWLKANTVKRRTHSLFRQGLMLYNHLPNWPDDRIRPLMEKFGSMLAEQRVFKEIFGVI